jgi:hypothetical protein
MSGLGSGGGGGSRSEHDVMAALNHPLRGGSKRKNRTQRG